MNPAGRLVHWALQPLLLSFAILAAAWVLAPGASAIPASFSGLWLYGPWLALAALAILGLVYRRGRVLLVTLLFGLGLALQEQAISPAGTGQPRLEHLIVTLVVPVNLALVAWLRERGVLTVFGIVRLAFVLGELLLLVGWWRFWPLSFDHSVARIDFGWLNHRPGAPLAPAGYAALSGSGVALLAAAWRRRSHFGFGLLVAYAGYVAGLLRPEHTSQLHAGSIAIGLILCIAILRDAYNLAYRDELTGLPQRRSLNELCMSLSGSYAVAMMDVDHFKKFNDTWGHDTGDDVLKMVATHVARVRDGGRAFRYGGEEFTVVYPSKLKEQATRSLEQVREAIESYDMVIRPPRTNTRDEASRRGKGAPAGRRTVAVTVSIGVADRSDRNDAPDDVIRKADLALYQAKKAGRNRVSLWTETRNRSRRK